MADGVVIVVVVVVDINRTVFADDEKHEHARWITVGHDVDEQFHPRVPIIVS